MFGKGPILVGSLLAALPAAANQLVKRQSSSLENCPGYTASNVQNDGGRVTADLALAGAACNVYGDDLTDLKLEVEYQTGMLGIAALLLMLMVVQKTVFMLRSTMLPNRSSRSRSQSGLGLRATTDLILQPLPWCSRTLTVLSRLPLLAARLMRRCSTPRRRILSLNRSISA